MHKTVPLDNLPTETTVQYFSWCEGICDLFCSLFRLSIQMFLLSTAPVQMYVVVLATFGLVLFLWQTGGFKRICIYKMYIFSITMVLPPYFFCQWNFHMHKKFYLWKKMAEDKTWCYISNFKDNINTCGGSISILHKSTKLGPYIILLVLMSARYQYMWNEIEVNFLYRYSCFCYVF